MQRGSLKKFFDKRKRVWIWRFQWREPGFKGPRTRDLGRCSDVSRAEAQAAAKQILTQVQGHVQRARELTITLSRFTEDEYLDLKTRHWKASTRATTEQLIRDHILAHLGDRMIHSLHRKELQSLLEDLAASGKSSSIVMHVRWQLSAILALAVADGLIKFNPAAELVKPRFKATGKKLVMAVEDLVRAQICLDIRERLIFRLGVWEGFRPGEIVGLKRGDYQNGELHISRRVYRRVVDTPKSERGDRTIPLTEGTNKVLGEYVKVADVENDSDWLFPSENPLTPLDYANVFRRRIRPALTKAGLGWVNFQIMRRTHATLLGEAEKDPRVRAELMGHSVDVHENEYRQVPIEAKRRAIKNLEERSTKMGDRLQ